MLSLLAAMIIADDFKPLAPLPSPRQVEWHSMERYCFVHFGPNTFTGAEWGNGKEPAQVFNPKKLDCRQWCQAFKAAGFSGVIVTAKHHDGFCLWPSKLSTHTVAQSPWKNGKGDVLKELSKACKESDLKFGVYLSPWDRNHPTYGTPQYNDTFKSMLKEVLTQYGPVFEVWFDGANGEGPNGKKQVYDWPGFIGVVRKFQPNAVIFSDAGPDVRWVGNENGYAGETNWNMIKRDRYVPGTPLYKELTEGDESGTDWVPAECDVSIRPGWFWRAAEDAKLKTVPELMDIWYGSVARGANLILNVPPNSDGLISDGDVKRLQEFNQAVQREFASDVPIVDAEAMSPSGAGLEQAHELLPSDRNLFWHDHEPKWAGQIQFSFAAESLVDRVEIREPIGYGQRIEKFHLHTADRTNGYKTLVSGTTIGVRRILKFPPTKAKEIWLQIDASRGVPALSRVRFYKSAG